jgi:hypothetical protein
MPVYLSNYLVTYHAAIEWEGVPAALDRLNPIP